MHRILEINIDSVLNENSSYQNSKILLIVSIQRLVISQVAFQFSRLKKTCPHSSIKCKIQFNYYQQQAEYYESYITDCLRKQTSSDRNKKPSKGIRASIRPGKSSQGIKYSASELMKKGVLVEVIDVDIKSPYKGLQVSHVGWISQRAKKRVPVQLPRLIGNGSPDSLANG